MTTALASLLTRRPVKHTVGMTGEVTLQGRVLPIGGLKQKVLAAHAAGLTDVIIPGAQPRRPRGRPRGRPQGDDLPPGAERRRGARARARAAPETCAAGGVSRFPRRSAARRTSSNGAGRSRSSTRPSRGRRASTSSARRSGASPRDADGAAERARRRRASRAARARYAPARRGVPTSHGRRFERLLRPGRPLLQAWTWLTLNAAGSTADAAWLPRPLRTVHSAHAQAADHWCVEEPREADAGHRDGSILLDPKSSRQPAGDALPEGPPRSRARATWRSRARASRTSALSTSFSSGVG